LAVVSAGKLPPSGRDIVRTNLSPAGILRFGGIEDLVNPASPI